jgi:hypothetical protein
LLLSQLAKLTKIVLWEESGVRSQESGVRSQESGRRKKEEGRRKKEEGVNTYWKRYIKYY